MPITPSGKKIAPLPMRPTGDPVVDFIKRQEGYIPEVYVDAHGHSIGYGHFITPEEQRLGTFSNRKLSEAEADALLRRDIKLHQDPWMNRLKVPITDAQKVALTSLAFNIGPTGGKSGKGGVFAIVDLMNEGKLHEAADKFLEYNKSRTSKDGPAFTNQQLVQRRRAERSIFLGETDYSKTDNPFLARSRLPAELDTSTSITSSRNLGNLSQGYTGSQDQMFSDNAEILKGMIELKVAVAGMPDFLSKQEYFNRVRREARGA